MTTTRIIVIQGPTQLLAAITVLQFQKDRHEYENCQDYLLIAHSCFQSEFVNQQITNACLEIAQSWNFNKILYLFDIEKMVMARKINFQEAIQQLTELLDFLYPDVIYVARNWQLTNELCLSAYSKARKICYGDGIIGFVSVKHHYSNYTFNPDGLLPIDAAYLISPGIEYGEGIFDSIDAEFINFDFLKSVLKRATQNIEGIEDYCNELRALGQPLSVVTLANATESRTAKCLEAEIALYISCILKSVNVGEKILVKGHPRQTFKQSTLVSNELQKHGLESFEISRFQYFPIEFFTPYIKIETAITLLSSSCVSLAHLCNCRVIVGYGDRFVNRYISASRQQGCIETQKIYAEITRRSFANTPSPITYHEYLEISHNPQTYDSPLIIEPSLEDSIVLAANNSDVDHMIDQLERDYLLIELSKMSEESNEIRQLNACLKRENVEKDRVVKEKDNFILTLQSQIEKMKSEYEEYTLEQVILLKKTHRKELRSLKRKLERKQKRIKKKRIQVRNLRQNLELSQHALKTLENKKSRPFNQKNVWLKNLTLSLDDMQIKLGNFIKRKVIGNAEYQGADVVASKLSESPLLKDCGVTEVSVYSAEKVIQDWKRIYDIDITSELKGVDAIRLYQCNQSKLRFFYPFHLFGSEYLYAQLEKFDWYYMPEKWEYEIATKDIHPSSSVLEIGSGYGFFIQYCQQFDIQVTGLETNSKAVAIARQNGLSVENCALETFVQTNVESFDVVCSFQVLEHVPDPASFLKHSLRTLKPGGLLILCVPNANSFLKHQYCLLDMPPHHMHQWSSDTFKYLESLFPLQLEAIKYEPLASYHISGYVDSYGRHLERQLPFGQLLFNSKTFPLYKKMLHNPAIRSLFRGQSLYARFRKI